MATPVGGLYVQVYELPLFYDSRRMLQLLSDTGTQATAAVFDDTTPPAAPPDLTAYNRALQLAYSVSGEIDANCQQGKRYAKADLEALALAGGKGGAVLKQLGADLWFGKLCAVRGYHGDQMRQLAPRYEEALALMNDLYEGKKVFDLSTAIEAGAPHRTTIGRNRIQSSEFIGLFGRWPDQKWW